jgi:hypothetical protein
MLSDENLVAEFPAMKQSIHTLRHSNHQFRRLYYEYGRVCTELDSVDGNQYGTSDIYMTNLKKQRLKVKDALATMLSSG